MNTTTTATEPRRKVLNTPQAWWQCGDWQTTSIGGLNTLELEDAVFPVIEIQYESSENDDPNSLISNAYRRISGVQVSQLTMAGKNWLPPLPVETPGFSSSETDLPGTININNLLIELAPADTRREGSAAAVGIPEGMPELASRFVKRVSDLRAVQRVILIEREAGWNIWTILDAAPGNRDVRERVYSIEQEWLDEAPDVPVDFRLVNLSEYPDPGALHLPNHETIYQRE